MHRELWESVRATASTRSQTRRTWVGRGEHDEDGGEQERLEPRRVRRRGP